MAKSTPATTKPTLAERRSPGSVPGAEPIRPKRRRPPVATTDPLDPSTPITAAYPNSFRLDIQRRMVPRGHRAFEPKRHTLERQLAEVIRDFALTPQSKLGRLANRFSIATRRKGLFKHPPESQRAILSQLATVVEEMRELGYLPSTNQRHTFELTLRAAIDRPGSVPADDPAIQLVNRFCLITRGKGLYEYSAANQPVLLAEFATAVELLRETGNMCDPHDFRS